MKSFKSIPEILLYIFLSFMAIYFVGGVWHYLVGLAFHFEYIKALQNVGFIISSVFVIWIMRTYFRNSFVTFSNSIKYFNELIGTSLLIFLVVFFSYIFCIYFFTHLGLVTIVINSVPIIIEADFIVKFLITGVILIIGEEIVYRGFLFNLIFYKVENKIIAIVVSSLVFSIAHFHYDSLLDFVTAFCGGIIMCILFLKYKSLYPSIFFHLGWNFSCSFFSIDAVNPLISTKFPGILDQNSELLELSILLVISLLLFRIEIFRSFQLSIRKGLVQRNDIEV